MESIHEAAEESDLFVFNGDTFDFKWSTLGSKAETVLAAVEFLRDFCARYPECQVHVNLGNHDHDHDFIKALDRLARNTENLTWHPYFLRVGSTIFLHGDVANRKMKHRDLERYRAMWSRHRQQGPLVNRAYDAAFRARAHVAISRLAFFPHGRTLRRVAAYLEDIGHSAEEGVEQVFFGHTHVAVPGKCFRGVTYHNGGAPMKGMQFTLLKCRV